MKIRLFATDLDGTIIPKGAAVSEAAVRTMQDALDSGLTVVPATGRCLENISPEILDLRGLRYVIASNGAVVMDMAQNRPVMKSLIPWRQAASMLRMIEGPEVYSCVYAENHIYNRTKLPDFMSRPDYLTGVFCKNPVEDLPSFIEKKRLGAETIFVTVWDPEPRNRLRKKLYGMPGILVTSSSVRNLEINRLGTDKGVALRKLAALLDISPEEVAAAGDNENDIEMLRFAGTAIVPEGCTPEARSAATVITRPCADGGVVDYLRELIRKM